MRQKDYLRLEKIKKFRQGGLSYTEIGEFFGISRQRIHQILMGYMSPYHSSEKFKEYKKNWAKKNAKKKV